MSTKRQKQKTPKSKKKATRGKAPLPPQDEAILDALRSMQTAEQSADNTNHNTSLAMRQAALLQLQRNNGNSSVQRALANAGDQASVQREDGEVDVQHGASLIPQPTPVSCWAAALDMVVSFRDSTSYPVAEIATRAGMNLTDGYGWPDIQNAVSAWGLQELAPMSAMPSYWADMLSRHGPLWIVEVGAPYHAVVLDGIHGGGSADDTEVHVLNPWPPNVGAVEYKTFEDFDNEFGLGAGAGAMIVHA